MQYKYKGVWSAVGWLLFNDQSQEMMNTENFQRIKSWNTLYILPVKLVDVAILCGHLMRLNRVASIHNHLDRVVVMSNILEVALS